MWENLKSILKDNKTKLIIIEDGKPCYIILPFEEYQHLQNARKNDTLEPERSREAAQDDYGSSINIEDLPF